MKSFPSLCMTSLLLVLSALSPMAGTTTGTMPVTSTVTAACTLGLVSTAPTLFSATATTFTGTQYVDVLCTKGAPFNVTLDQGLSPSANSTCNAPVRRLKKSDAAEYFPYQLQKSTNFTEAGCGTSNGFQGTSTSGTVNTRYTMYITATYSKDAPAGDYSDTVTVSLNF